MTKPIVGYRRTRVTDAPRTGEIHVDFRFIGRMPWRVPSKKSESQARRPRRGGRFRRRSAAGEAVDYGREAFHQFVTDHDVGDAETVAAAKERVAHLVDAAHHR